MPFENIMAVGLKREREDFLHSVRDNLWKAPRLPGRSQSNPGASRGAPPPPAQTAQPYFMQDADISRLRPGTSIRKDCTVIRKDCTVVSAMARSSAPVTRPRSIPPWRILPGNAPSPIRQAELQMQQPSPIPVFIKQAVDQWEYWGSFVSTAQSYGRHQNDR